MVRNLIFSDDIINYLPSAMEDCSVCLYDRYRLYQGMFPNGPARLKRHSLLTNEFVEIVLKSTILARFLEYYCDAVDFIYCQCIEFKVQLMDIYCKIYILKDHFTHAKYI